jgi:hypothetical protein
MVDLGSHNLCKMEQDNNFEIQELPSRTRVSSNVFYTFIRPCVAEMLATMCFVFVDLCSVGSPYHAGLAGFTHGFVLFVLVAATATVRYVVM